MAGRVISKNISDSYLLEKCQGGVNLQMYASVGNNPSASSGRSGSSSSSNIARGKEVSVYNGFGPDGDEMEV